MKASMDRAHLAVSLFPFLSVLACVTGTLSFLISGMSTMALAGSEQIIELTAEGTRKRPNYVETRNDGLLLHPDGEAVALDQIENEKGAFVAMLDRIRARNSEECLILLVRPDGLEAFDAARSAATAYMRRNGVYIDFGYDAVYAAGPIEIRRADAAEDALK
jgi:hypothetical protein